LKFFADPAVCCQIGELFLIFHNFLFYKWHMMYYNIKVEGVLHTQLYFSDWKCSE